MLNLHRFRPSRAIPLRYNRDTDPRSAGSSISSLGSSGRRRRQRISHPRSRQPDIHLRVVLFHFCAPSPRSYLHTPHYNGDVLVKTMKIFRGRALTSKDDREVRKKGMNTKLIVFRTKCVHVYELPSQLHAFVR